MLTARGAATLCRQLHTGLSSFWMAGGKSAEAESNRYCHSKLSLIWDFLVHVILNLLNISTQNYKDKLHIFQNYW